MMMKLTTTIALAALCTAAPLSAQIVDLGQIEFANSGAEAAQEPFLRGVLLLHSFEYADAREEFQRAQEADADFALAYWGEALTHSHPLWRQEDVDAARAALGKLAPTPDERALTAGSERERRFLNAVELLFGDGDRIQRHQAYSDALGDMWADDPKDLEAGSFYALSILGKSLGVRDERLYMQAAAIGEEVYRLDPEHPGALHYLIHSYDDPVHAPLGLRMARTYDKVAPAASHALHMPSHIYVALGMWDESALANENSVKAADARRARKQLDVDARGWHAFWWLHYSYLQQGRIEAATKLLQEAQRETEAAGTRRTRYHLAVMRAAHLVETRAWDSPFAELKIDHSELRRPTVAADLCIQGFAAIGRGELERAREIVATMRGKSPWAESNIVPGANLASCCAPASAVTEMIDAPGRMAAEVMARELEGAVRLAAGEREPGLKLLRSAAELEDQMGFDFGPPLVVWPAHELLGEALLREGDAAGAIAEFQAALARAPRRAASLLRLMHAAEAQGDTALAETTRRELARAWRNADAPVLELLETKTRPTEAGTSAPGAGR